MAGYYGQAAPYQQPQQTYQGNQYQYQYNYYQPTQSPGSARSGQGNGSKPTYVPPQTRRPRARSTGAGAKKNAR